MTSPHAVTLQCNHRGAVTSAHASPDMHAAKIQCDHRSAVTSSVSSPIMHSVMLQGDEVHLSPASRLASRMPQPRHLSLRNQHRCPSEKNPCSTTFASHLSIVVESSCPHFCSVLHLMWVTTRKYQPSAPDVVQPTCVYRPTCVPHVDVE